MACPKNEVPTYKLHKSTGLARCWVKGQWVSLGRYGSPESKSEFERVLAELRSGAPAATVTTKPAPGVTVDELLVAFMKHAEQHYHRRSDGTPSGQTGEFKASESRCTASTATPPQRNSVRSPSKPCARSS